MVAEIFGGISALKAAFDMTKTFADMSDAAKRDRLSINLQKEILAAQAAQAELVEEISSLKANLATRRNNVVRGHGMAYFCPRCEATIDPSVEAFEQGTGQPKWID